MDSIRIFPSSAGSKQVVLTREKQPQLFAGTVKNILNG